MTYNLCHHTIYCIWSLQIRCQSDGFSIELLFFSNVFVEKHQIGFLTERSQVERGIMVYCLVAGWWCTNYVSCLVRILHDIPQRFGCFSAARVDGIVVPVLNFSNL